MADDNSSLPHQPLLGPAERAGTSSDTTNRISVPAAPSGRSTDEILSVPVPLQVRFSDGSSDLSMELPSRALIQAIRDNIYQTYPHFNGKYLRLIHKGRELPDHDASIAQLIGFDRLREAGFSEEDIEQLREQFHQLRGTDAATEPVNDEEDLQARREEEEAWIENNTNTLPDGMPQGSYNIMLYGIVVGFFGGLFTIILCRETLFTQRQKLGIFAGFLINVAIGVLHLFY
ncbi:DUF2407 C-terminal domain-containing protein [Syncephalis fuscata]|nr:DUF2407 C-terminal domain-containing protein [Syncephalis fuscata]